jgi:TetR/AcrR family transcriptional regulator, cholesterol catabolism regulator
MPVMPSQRDRGSGRAAPVARRRRNREQEVLDAAVEVFWRKGYSAASVQEVADAVGVLKGSLYHYISSKEDLLFRIFDASHHDALAIMDAVSALDQPPLARLREYIVRFVTYYVSNIERVGLYYREWRSIEGERAALIRDQRRDYDRYVRTLIEEARRAGEIPESTDPKLAAFFVNSAINGISDWYGSDGALSSGELAELYADLTLAAVGAHVAA